VANSHIFLIVCNRGNEQMGMRKLLSTSAFKGMSWLLSVICLATLLMLFLMKDSYTFGSSKIKLKIKCFLVGFYFILSFMCGQLNFLEPASATAVALNNLAVVTVTHRGTQCNRTVLFFDRLPAVCSTFDIGRCCDTLTGVSNNDKSTGSGPLQWHGSHWGTCHSICGTGT